MTSDQYTELKQKMLKSIYQNGGFYIGKYETGIEGTPRTSGDANTMPTETPVIKQNAYPYNWVTSSQAQTIASKFASGLNGYTSSLLFGLQWDLTLKYLESKGVTQAELNEDSTNWGNYYDNLWNITNINSKYSTNGRTWTNGAYGKKSSSVEVLLSTGASDTFSKQGIYDLAGNVAEWTLEAYSFAFRAGRGGFYGATDRGTASDRYNYYPTVTGADIGSRLALYKDVALATDSDEPGTGSKDPVIVDVVDPVWKVENINIDQENQKLTADVIATDKYLTGIANSTLTTDDITITVDGDANANNAITKALSAPTFSENASTGLKEIKYTLTLDNWGESAKQAGKSYLEYSGSTKIKIAEGTVVDDAEGALEPGQVSDGKHNTSKEQTFELGHVDFIKPSFTYKYANTEINHDTKTVTVVFDITDKYFSASQLATDAVASKIKVNFEGKEATNATKVLTKLSDITETVNGVENTKVGEKYQLVVSNLDQGNGGDYSGIMTLCFNEGAITDTAGNGNVAKVITIGVDEPRKGVKPSELFDSTGSDTNKLHIGDFINYDAGTWTQEEINSIQTGLKTNLQTANGSTDLPANGYQFGGFTAGSSRNENATPFIDITGGKKYGGYLKDTSTNSAITGWRVFDIDGDNITLISAGNPEDYNNPYGNDESYISEYILGGNVNSNWSTGESSKSNYQKRDWGLYVNSNQKATSALPLTKSRLDQWYTKYTDSPNADVFKSEVFEKIYKEPYRRYQTLMNNYSNYFLTETEHSNYMYIYAARNMHVMGHMGGSKMGIRMLVTLSSDVLLSSERTGTKTLTGGNMDTYGGDQTFNCWNIVTATEGESGSKDPVIVDVVDPVWKVENVKQDTENQKVTLDLVATDKYLTGVENSTLTADDITISVDGDENANNVIKKTLSEPTFSGDGPYIPTGYSHVAGTSLDNGFTVQDSKGNQFVWVEVPKTADVYPTAGLKITEFTTDAYTKIENDLHTYTSVYR